MKKLLITNILMISSSIFAQEVIVLDKKNVVSIETRNREVLNINDIRSFQSNNISIRNGNLQITRPDLINNIELQNGEVVTPVDIININLNARSGGQDGGGG